LKSKIRTALKDYDGIVIGGSDNFTYLTGVVLPFPTNYPDRPALIVRAVDGHENIICPYDWSDSVTQQGWKAGVHTYDENKNLPPHGVVQSLTDVLSEMRLTDKKLAVDKSRIPTSLFETMKQKLPNVEWVACDETLKSLRIEKTKEEVDMLEVAAKHSASGIVSALNHLEGTVDVPGYAISEFSERVRVHVYEFGGSGVGYLATMQGAGGQTYYSPPLQFEMFRPGELVRMDVTNHNRGYWSNTGRMAVIGEPSKEQASAYEDNRKLKEAAVVTLVPSKKSRDVFGAVVAVNRLWNVFREHDAELVEVNRVGLLCNGDMVAVDAKLTLDDKSLFRQKEVIDEMPVVPYDGKEGLAYRRLRAKELGIPTYIEMEGEIGVLSDGAGTGMLTLDLIHDAGGKIRVYCEMGGEATPELMEKTLTTAANAGNVRVVLVSLIGGLNRMDEMAEGIVRYVNNQKSKPQIVVRMAGR